MTIEKIIKIAEELGWRVDLSKQDNDNGGVDKIASFYQFSPAGEDFGFDIFYTDAKNLVDEIAYYYANFNVDKHIEMWIEARRNGVGGVPSTRILCKDAEDIDNMLMTLYTKLNMEEI